jgi:hypothetical protein
MGPKTAETGLKTPKNELKTPKIPQNKAKTT